MVLKNVAPLKGSFMITSIVGILISLMYIFPRSAAWGFTFTAFFVIMFIASMISMTYGPEEAMLHRGHEIERKVKKREEISEKPIRGKPQKTKKRKKKKRKK